MARKSLILLVLLAAASVSTPPTVATSRDGILQLSTVPDWSAEGDQADGLFGNRVASAGDVNGDGYGDAFVTGFRYDSPDIDEGKIFLYLGSATGLALTPAWTAEGDVANAQLGNARSAGDVNGDGYGDVIIGVGSAAFGQRALVYHGSASGLATSASWEVQGDQALSSFGGRIASAGDVNGDGYDDVLVGATFYDGDFVDGGRAFLYMGSAQGLSTTPAWTASGSQQTALFGVVAGIGDVTGDGFDDVAVGASAMDNAEVDEGVVYLYKGSPSGLKTRPFRVLEINEASARFGAQLSAAGDIDADGYDDFIVQAMGVNSPGFVQRVFVYMGRRNGPRPVADVVLQSDQPTTSHFGIDLNTAGDVNGDGYSDIIVGARLYQAPLANQGRAFVYAGSTNGLISVPLQTFDGEQAFEEFGIGVSTAGDVNGDGFDDIIIGAHAWDNPENNEGRAVVFHGGP